MVDLRLLGQAAANLARLSARLEGPDPAPDDRQTRRACALQVRLIRKQIKCALRKPHVAASAPNMGNTGPSLLAPEPDPRTPEPSPHLD